MKFRWPSMASNTSDEVVRTAECVRDDQLSSNEERDAAEEAAVFWGPLSAPAPGSRNVDGAAHHAPLKEQRLGVAHLGKDCLAKIACLLCGDDIREGN